LDIYLSVTLASRPPGRGSLKGKKGEMIKKVLPGDHYLDIFGDVEKGGRDGVKSGSTPPCI
jgi:hypothetical protein